MKKIVRLFSIFTIVFSICLLASCDLSSIIPNLSGSGSTENEGTSEVVIPDQLQQIYEMAVRQGYTGTYEDWLNELKGDQVEIRANDGYIQWRYKGASEWQNIIPLSDLEGADGLNGQNGLTPYIGENGNWFIGGTDTGVFAGGSQEDLVQYKVTFDDGCGNVVETEVDAKQPVEKPEDPKKTGFIFIGWYCDDVEWNFNANVVLKDITLEAKWVKSSIMPSVGISYIYADKTNVYFELDKDDVSKIEAITLYKGGRLIETLANNDLRQFSNLLSNNEYKLEVTYSYDLNDGFGVQTKTTTSYVTTSHKKTPDITVNNIEVTYNSIDVDITLYDEDEVAVFKRVELYNGKELVSTSENVEDIHFGDLHSGVTYSGKVYYEYDFNDGKKAKEYCFEFSATTSKIYQPVVTLNNISATQNQITAEVIIADASKVDQLVSISLYKDNEIIHQGMNLNLNYKNLTPNTKYKIVVEHKYDLNDGKGMVTVKDEFVVATHPVYQLFDTEILNTSAILEGETVFIHATINNSSEATFKYVYIDGVEYPVNPSSNSKNVFVEIPAVAVGDTTFTINKLVADRKSVV